MGASGSKQEEATLNAFSLNENSSFEGEKFELIQDPPTKTEIHLKTVKIWFFLSFLKNQLLLETGFTCLCVDSFNSYMKDKFTQTVDLLKLWNISEHDFITTSADDISVYLKHLQITRTAEQAVETMKPNSFYQIHNDFYIMFSKKKSEWWYDFEAYTKFMMLEISVY